MAEIAQHNIHSEAGLPFWQSFIIMITPHIEQELVTKSFVRWKLTLARDYSVHFEQFLTTAVLHKLCKLANFRIHMI